MLDEFIGEVLGEMIIVPLFNAVLTGVWWVLRTGVLLALYPLMLLTGWLRLWMRERGRLGFGRLWLTHGHAGLYRFGWQEAALDVEYLIITLLIALAGVGMCLVVYAILSQWFL